MTYSFSLHLFDFVCYPFIIFVTYFTDYFDMSKQRGLYMSDRNIFGPK